MTRDSDSSRAMSLLARNNTRSNNPLRLPAVSSAVLCLLVAVAGVCARVEAAPATFCVSGGAPSNYNPVIDDANRDGFQGSGCALAETLRVQVVVTSPTLADTESPFVFSLTDATFAKDVAIVGMPNVTYAAGAYGPMHITISGSSFAEDAGFALYNSLTPNSVVTISGNKFADYSTVYGASLSFLFRTSLPENATLTVSMNKVANYDALHLQRGGIFFNSTVDIQKGALLCLDGNVVDIVFPAAQCPADQICSNGIYFSLGVVMYHDANLTINNNTVQGSNHQAIFLGYLSFAFVEGHPSNPTVSVQRNTLTQTGNSTYGRGIWINTLDENLKGGGRIDVMYNKVMSVSDGTVPTTCPILIRAFQSPAAMVPYIINVAYNEIVARGTIAAFIFSMQLTAPGSVFTVGYNTVDYSVSTNPVFMTANTLVVTDLLLHVIGNRVTSTSATAASKLFRFNGFPDFGVGRVLACNNTLEKGGGLIEVNPSVFSGALVASEGVVFETSYCYRCGCTGSLNASSTNPSEWCLNEQYCCSYSPRYFMNLKCPQPNFPYDPLFMVGSPFAFPTG